MRTDGKRAVSPGEAAAVPDFRTLFQTVVTTVPLRTAGDSTPEVVVMARDICADKSTIAGAVSDIEEFTPSLSPAGAGRTTRR